MESFGAFLKKERESRSISLEEISASTRIRKVFLEAIEAGDVEKLPGEVFVKGFVQAYSRYLGLDESDVLARYNEDWEGLEGAVEEESPRIEKSALSWNFVLTLSLLLILCIALVIYLNQKGNNKEGPAIPPDSEEKISMQAPVPRPVKEPVYEEEPTQEGRETGLIEEKSPEGTDFIFSLANEGDMVPEAADNKVEPPIEEEKKILLAKALEMTWLKIEIDNSPPLEVILKPGESKTWTALQGFKLRIGNAGGVELSYNGKPVTNLGESGKVVSLTFPGDESR